MLFYVCTFFSVSTFASGYLEQARSIFYGDAKSRYEEMIRYIDQSNIDDAKESTKQFHDQLRKIEGLFYQINQDKEVLNEQCRNLWNDLYGSQGGPFKGLSINTGVVENSLGRQPYKSALEDVKKNYEECSQLINKVYDAFKEYGKETFRKQNTMETVLLDHEAARSIFNGDYKSRYEEAIKYIEQSNFSAAKESLDKLKELKKKIQGDFDWIDNEKDLLISDSKNVWNDFFPGSSSPWATLCVTSGLLEDALGKYSYNNILEKMKDTFKRCGELIDKIYESFKNHRQGHSEKQKKMIEICDSCN